MPGAAIVAAALTDHSSRYIGIYVDGVDVSGEPAASPRYAVPDSSISINDMDL